MAVYWFLSELPGLLFPLVPELELPVPELLVPELLVPPELELELDDLGLVLVLVRVEDEPDWSVRYEPLALPLLEEPLVPVVSFAPPPMPPLLLQPTSKAAHAKNSNCFFIL